MRMPVGGRRAADKFIAGTVALQATGDGCLLAVAFLATFLSLGLHSVRPHGGLLHYPESRARLAPTAFSNPGFIPT
jgi:hypothetical protein